MSKSLDALRKQIDKTDKFLLKTLAWRFALTRKVGAYKAKHGLSPRDTKREKEVFVRLHEFAKKLHLNKQMVEKMYLLIMKTARAEHKKLKNK